MRSDCLPPFVGEGFRSGEPDRENSSSSLTGDRSSGLPVDKTSARSPTVPQLDMQPSCERHTMPRAEYVSGICAAITELADPQKKHKSQKQGT